MYPPPKKYNRGTWHEDAAQEGKQTLLLVHKPEPKKIWLLKQAFGFEAYNVLHQKTDTDNQHNRTINTKTRVGLSHLLNQLPRMRTMQYLNYFM